MTGGMNRLVSRTMEMRADETLFLKTLVGMLSPKQIELWALYR